MVTKVKSSKTTAKSTSRATGSRAAGARAARARATPLAAPVLGTIQLPPAMRDALVHPDPAPLHGVPQDAGAEVALARVENLLGKGHFGAALREAAALKLGDAALAGRYEFVRQEKLCRAHIGIAARYFLRGDRKSARSFYERALAPDTTDPAVKEVAELAGKAFDNLASQRATLIRGLKDDIQKNDFAQWCGRKRTLTNVSIVDTGLVQDRIYPDFRLEDIFGEQPPIDVRPGYLDPLPPETEVVAFPSAMPGATFRAATDAAVEVDAPPPGVTGKPPGDRLRASLVMPVVANVLTAKLGLFALDQGLSVAGQADGVVPLFRYEHLREKAKELIAQVQTIETRMLPIQFELDDFAEAVEAIRRPLAAQQAELEAVKQRIAELTQDLAALAQVEQAMKQVVIALDQAESDCDCDWFCWLCTIVGGLFVALAVVTALLAIAFALIASGGTAAIIIACLLAGASGGVAGAAGMWYAIITYQAFTCENVGTIGRQMKASLAGVEGTIADNEAELQHALATRDILIASINALTDQLDQVYQSNAARVLDAKTLDAIQAQYNSLRQSLLTRAQTTAKLAENAFNFERDAEASLIRDAYYDPALKGYTAAETLLHDLGGLDHIDVTGRTRKAMQFSQMVSLRKHNPLSYLALVATRTGRFTTSLADFDRWYPGTYLQRIKEVRVEILVDGNPVPARGYISNDGVSLVRFADPDNKRPVDNVRVFDEPDADVAKLCYKRLQRRRHIDSMAFPEFESQLYDDRMRKLQGRERNFFENVGLESTWLIELLPDQPFDLSRATDIRVWFQYEALFDDNLKRILEPKRYAGRRVMAAVPIGQTLRDPGGTVDFAHTLNFKTTPALFDNPALDKTIVNAGLGVRLKEGRRLGGAVTLEVAFEGAPAVTVTTEDTGVVATAPDHPAGTGLTELAAMVHGKSVAGSWTVRLTGLPSGIATDDVDEIFLLLHCEYAA
jgi:tetratricopeptide (TPR) repeat protein